MNTVWTRFWMRFAGPSRGGRCATWLATWFAPPFRWRRRLARMNPRGYVSPSACVTDRETALGMNVFIGDRVFIMRNRDGGSIRIGDRVELYADIVVETGAGGRVTIGNDTHIQPRCTLSAYVGMLHIGDGVEIAPNCSFYPYNHGTAPDRPIREQPLTSKGDLVVGNGAWIGAGAILLDGARVGEGSVIGAGSVVTRPIPDNAVAWGAPARVRHMR